MTFDEQRARMVDLQLARRGISDERVLAAFRAVPRESFVPAVLTELAYRDGPLPIGEESDHFPALHRRAHDPGIGPRGRRTGAGYRNRLWLRGGGAAPTSERLRRCRTSARGVPRLGDTPALMASAAARPTGAETACPEESGSMRP